MGLDVVELVMAVEDEFEIRLDDHFGDIRTVGDLHDVIWQQLKVSQRHKLKDTCPSFLPFFTTRDALISLTKVDPKLIRPSTQLADLVEIKKRRTHWTQIQAETCIELPSLQLTTIGGIAFQLSMILVVATTGFLCWATSDPDITALTVLAAFFVVLLSYLVSRPFAIAFPTSCQTIGDIVRLARIPRYSSQSSEWLKNPERFWAKVVSIVSEELDVPRIEITRDARFVEDLKCG